MYTAEYKTVFIVTKQLTISGKLQTAWVDAFEQSVITKHVLHAIYKNPSEKLLSKTHTHIEGRVRGNIERGRERRSVKSCKTFFKILFDNEARYGYLWFPCEIVNHQ